MLPERSVDAVENNLILTMRLLRSRGMPTADVFKSLRTAGFVGRTGEPLEHEEIVDLWAAPTLAEIAERSAEARAEREIAEG